MCDCGGEKNCAAVAINKPREGRIKKEKKKREKKPRLEIKALSQFPFRRSLLLFLLLLFLLGLSCFPSPFQQPPKNTWHRRLFTTKKDRGRIFFPPSSHFFFLFFASHFPKDVLVIARFDHVKKPFEGSAPAKSRGRPAAPGDGGVQKGNGGSRGGCVWWKSRRRCKKRLWYSPPGSRRTVAAP